MVDATGPTIGAPAAEGDRAALPAWTLLTNHAHVLLCINEDPTIRIRDIARLVGITERAAHKIVADLGVAGFLTRVREGRRNRYTVNRDTRLRHPLEGHHTVGELLDVVGGRSQCGPDPVMPG